MPEKLRVLIVTNTYPTMKEPGATPCIKDQLLALRAQGMDVDLFYIDRFNKLNYLKAAWKLAMMSFRPKQYDLIHAHYGHCGLLVRLQFKCPVIVTFHGSDLLGRKDGIIGKIAARWAESVIVMTEEMKRVSKRPDAHIVPFGVNTNLFHPYPSKHARQALNLPLDAKLVLFPWNPARPVKRFDIVEEAIQILRQTHPEVRLETVFDRPREVIARYMQACNVMVLASNHEGSPMAVREAVACGLPVVSVDVGDIHQIIGHIEGCYLCTQNAHSIAECLGTVLAKDERLNETQISKNKDAAEVAKQIIAIYSRTFSKTAEA